MTARADDEVAAIQVVEAILVAVLVAGALIFFALAQRPSFPADSGGRDQSRVAADALALLQGQDPGADAAPATIDQLGLVLRNVFNDQPRQVERDRIDAALPDGTMWSLRLYNGFGRLEVLASATISVAPRETGAATAFASINVPGSGAVDEPRPLERAPRNLPAPPSTCTLSYNSMTTAPSGKTWLEEWDAWLDVRPVPRDTIPDFAPFGSWNYGTGSCDDPFQVSLQTGTAVGMMVYSVELVVWDAF